MYLTDEAPRAPRGRPRKDAPPRTTKVCGRCRVEKPLSEYSRRKQKGGTWGVHSYCKPCNVANMKEWSYGITQADYDAMLEQQGGRCAICRWEPTGERKNGRLHIDHDHDTGRVRGLLCRPCNQGIGLFRDNPERLIAAAAYLQGGQ